MRRRRRGRGRCDRPVRPPCSRCHHGPFPDLPLGRGSRYPLNSIYARATAAFQTSTLDRTEPRRMLSCWFLKYERDPKRGTRGKPGGANV